MKNFQKLSKKPFYFRFYLVGAYILPIALAINPILGVFAVFLSFVLFLSTYWTISSHKLLFFEDSKEGKYIIHNNKVLEIIKKDKIEYFYSDGQKYIFTKNGIQQIIPKFDFPISEYLKFYKNNSSEIHSYLKTDYKYFPDNSINIVNSVSFMDIFVKQCTTPIFCFQIFSSLLMIFDEYILQSLFSISMTIFFEAAMSFSRLQTLKMFRSFKNKEVDIEMIYNFDNKESVKSTELKFGDIFIINNISSKIPCDCILMEGECVVNEAMLSGESTPLLKSDIKNIQNKNVSLKINDFKGHILFSGTEILKIENNILKCIAIRTGSNTEQGNLLTKMTSDENMIDMEALKFVVILTLNSLIASIITAYYSKKSGYARFLEMIVLFTNSIPFELPMEMNMSIQSAIRECATRGIYCLEPFRMGLAGRVQVCCFDKTGTLTSNQLELFRLETVDNINSDIKKESLLYKLLYTCNDLVEIGGKPQGDSIDSAIRNYIDQKLKNQTFGENFKILKKYPFSSESRRQSVITEIDGKTYFITKGAPEEIFKLSKNDRKDLFKKFSEEGFRVLGICHKEITNINDAYNHSYDECTFDAFLLFNSHLKEYSKEMISILKESGHKICVITGDNLLTAKNICFQLGLEDVNGIDMSLNVECNYSDLVTKYNLFGRADPKQKERIIQAYKNKGLITMMVGDGTNDVGALKVADVGVAVLEPINKINSDKTNINNLSSNLNNMMLNETIMPGDASMAAPFTVRTHSLQPIVEIIKTGRATSVTTIQMYKIIALNNIINAFTMGSMDMLGLKFTEKQMVTLGILQSLAFNAISRGKALETISKSRVVESIFTKYIILSIIGQSLIHIGSYFYVTRNIISNSIQEIINEDGTTSLTNSSESITIIFILTAFQVIATFAANYIGRPFREDISENPQLSLSLIGLLGAAINCLLNFHSEINLFLGIVDLGDKTMLLSVLCFGVLISTFLIEKICTKLFLVDKKYIKSF